MAGIWLRLKTALSVEAVVVPAGLLYLTPHWPRTLPGWVLVVSLGAPLWLAIEYASSQAGEVIPGDAVASALYGMAFLLLLVGGYYLAWSLVGDYLRPHFY